MKARYYVLVALTLVFGAISFYARSRQWDWVESLASNLAAGFLGSFLIVLLVDRALERQRARQTEQARSIALRVLRPFVLQHIMLLSDWHKASAEKPPSKLPNSLAETFSSDYFEQIRFLDFSKDAPVDPKMSWLQWTGQQFDEFSGQISRIIDKYSFFLETRTLDRLENLANSILVKLLTQLAKSNLFSLDKAHNVVRTYNLLECPSVQNEVRHHTQLLVSFVDWFNQAVPAIRIEIDGPGLWRQDIQPKVGSARIEANSVFPGSSKIALGKSLPPGNLGSPP